MSIKETLHSLLNEIKAALKEYASKQEAALKMRFKKVLTISIIGAVLLALGITLAGSAALFILIGSLKYLSTFMPAWAAWLIIGATAAIAAAALFGALYIIIRKQLATPQTATQQQPEPQPGS